MADDLLGSNLFGGLLGGDQDQLSLLLALTPPQQMNPMQQVGSMLSGFAAGTRGQPNPVLEQFQQQAAQDQRNRLAVAGVMQSVQRERREKHQTQMKLLEVFAQSPDTSAREWAYGNLLSLGEQQMGLKPPPGMASRLALRTLGKEEQSLVIGEILAQIPMDETMRKHPNLTSQDYQGYYLPLSQNREGLKHFGYDDPEKILQSREAHEMKVHKEKLDALGLGGEGPIPSNARLYIKQTYLKDPWDALPGEALTARAVAEEPVKRRMRELSDAARRRLDLATEGGKRAATLASLHEFKQIVEPLNKQVEIVRALNTLDRLVDKLPNLPTPGATWGEVEMKKWQRAWQNPTDPNLFTFKQLVTPVLVGQVDRSVFDEKAVRAVVAFQKQLEVADKIPTAEAFHQYIDTIRGLLKSNARLKMNEAKLIPTMSPATMGVISTLIAPAFEDDLATTLIQEYLK